MKRSWFARWRAHFFTGLAVVLPVALSIGLVLWLFGTISNFTDTLLFFLPDRITHRNQGAGPVFWYWSLVALCLAVALVALIGRLTANYLGQQLINAIDRLLLHVPMLNKIYGTMKQVNEAFSSNKKSSFRQVVLLQFPRPGIYSVGFVTGDQNQEVQARTGENLVSVFIPTTPNPTSGFLVLVPQNDLTRLDMSVADGIKFIISLGSVAPEFGPTHPGIPASARPLP